MKSDFAGCGFASVFAIRAVYRELDQELEAGLRVDVRI